MYWLLMPIMGIFSIKPSVPDKGITYDIGTLNSRVAETAQVNDCNGNVVQLVEGNRNYVERSLDVTYGDDFNQIQSIDPTVCNNLMTAVLMGQPFDYGSDRYVILGTQGARNVGTFVNNLDHKYIFLEEGKVNRPDLATTTGEQATEDNGFITAYTKNNPIMFETKYAFNSSNVKGDRFVYYLPSEISKQEGSGTDFNKYSVSAMRYCDVRSIGSNYFIEGLTNAQALEISGTDSIYRVEADIIIEISGGGTPTLAGTAGDQAVVIDSDDNTVELYKYTTTWSADPVTSTLGEGCLIHSNSTDTALDGATATTESVYVAIKTAGTTGNAVCIDAKTGTTGSGTNTGIIRTYDWIYSSQDFEAYSIS